MYSLRPARKEDALVIARIWFMSSHGILDYYFTDLKPGLCGTQVFQHIVALEKNPYGYPQWQVAEHGGRVIGAVNVYSHEQAKELTDLPLGELFKLGPAALVRFAARSLALGDLLGLRLPNRLFSEMAKDHPHGTLYLNCIGVLPPGQGQGAGSALLGWAETEARNRTAPSISLHAWGDNLRALSLYERHGYAVARHFYPKLPEALRYHQGGKVFMLKSLV